jgi:tetratricopeptide (TPR) repeat protein
MGGRLRGTGQSLQEAVSYLNDALLGAIKGNMLELQPGILLELGTVIGHQGDLSGAIRCFNEMIALAHTIGDYFHEALGYNGLATQALAVGDMTMASHALEDGLALARAHRVRLVYQWLYITRGKLALAERRWQEADTWLKRAAAEAERFGAVAQAATCNAYLGLVALGRQRQEDAARLLEAARVQASLGAETYFQADVLLSLAELYHQRGASDLAAARFQEAQGKLAHTEYPLLQRRVARLQEQRAALDFGITQPEL